MEDSEARYHDVAVTAGERVDAGVLFAAEMMELCAKSAQVPLKTVKFRV